MSDEFSDADRERIRDRHRDDQFWAQRRGKRYPPGVAFHHLDGDPHNNDPDNLVVIDPRDNAAGGT